jgi:hypothetical protein
MHCRSCDCLLTDYETNRKDISGNYIDLCSVCYTDVKDDILSTDDDDVFFIEKHDYD